MIITAFISISIIPTIIIMTTCALNVMCLLLLFFNLITTSIHTSIHTPFSSVSPPCRRRRRRRRRR